MANPGMRSRFARWWYGDPKRKAKPQPTEQTRVRYGHLGPEVAPLAFSGGATSGYGSAKATSEYNGGKSRRQAPHAHSLYELEELVAESQRMRRDNTLYRTLIRRLTDIVVGAGLSFQSRTGDAALDAAIEREVRAFWESCDVRGMVNGTDFQRMLIDQKLTDGRQLLVFDSVTGTVQVIASERLHSDTQKDEDGNPIYHGVAVDSVLRPLAYHVCDWDANGTYLRHATTLTADAVYYDAYTERFDQVAAPPPLQAIFPTLHRINDVWDSEAASWQLLARFAVAITKKGADQTAWANSTAEQNPQTGAIADRVSEVNGYALIFNGEPGDEIKGIERNVPGANFGNTVREFLRLCGMELGLSLEFFLLDWSQTNYSSGRASARQVWRHALPWQSGLARALEWCTRKRIAWVVAQGGLPRTALDAAQEWIADPFEPLDPDKENTADAGAVDSGFKTSTRVLKERRIELADHLAERSKELADAAALVEKHNAAHPECKVSLAHFLGGKDLVVADPEPEPQAALPLPPKADDPPTDPPAGETE